MPDISLSAQRGIIPELMDESFVLLEDIGSVMGVSIAAGGTGYSASFAVSFSGGGGTGATATATAVSGVVKNVTMTAFGKGYTSAPTPSFAAGGGSGATGAAILDGLFWISPFGDLNVYLGSYVLNFYGGGGYVDVSYVARLVATVGEGGSTYSITVDVLPLGLSLNSSTGLITGIPTISGSYTFTAQAVDSAGQIATRVCTIVILLPSDQNVMY